MALRIRGEVAEVEVSEGTFDDGRSWTSRTVHLMDGVEIHSIKFPNSMELPEEGQRVEVVVGIGMRANPGDILNPYRITFRAHTFAVLDAAEADGRDGLAVVGL